MGGLIRMDERPERNARIIALRERHVRWRDIAGQFGITMTCARMIFEKHKDRQEEKKNNILRGLGLDTRAYRIIAKATGIKEPTLIDLQAFIKNDGDWKRCIRRAPNGGPATVEKVEAFARAHGIIS